MGKPLHVLIVEDSEDDTLLMVQKLRKGGYEPVYKRVETPQAMRVALKERWDMVISDNFMPAFNAPDALNMLKENDPDVPFIIVSGNIEPDIAMAALQAGARDYIKKDDMERLMAVVDRELGGVEQRARESTYSLVVENMQDIAWISDRELRLSYINGAVTGVLGYTVKEALERGLPGMLSRSSLLKLRRTLEGDMGVSPGKIGLELVSRDSTTVYTETSLKLIKDKHGSQESVLGVMRDVTERKYGEAFQHNVEVNKLIQHLMWSLWQMAGGIAHEINNPLAVISGYAQMLMKKDLKSEVKQEISAIYEGAQRISAVVNRMLQFASRDNTAHVPVNINNVIEVSLDWCLHDLKADDIAITIQLAVGLPPVAGDAARLQQVFVELITNARLEMTGAHGRGKLYIETRALDDKVSVTVRDDGPGIEEENLERIFEPFFTTRPVGKGQGLGLSLCYSIISAHGGDIYALSKPGKGATFIVNLPAAGNTIARSA